MRILGIDFGLKNLGLAISEGPLAEPLATLKIVNLKDSQEQLIRICLKNKIDLVVIGMPQGQLLARVKEFTLNFQKNFRIPVVFQDETLTSKEAVLKMIEAGKPKQQRKRDKHIMAACLILQSYLDQKQK